MIQLIKCHLLNKHSNDCWIVDSNDKDKVKAMCPYCGKLVIKDKEGIWRKVK